MVSFHKPAVQCFMLLPFILSACGGGGDEQPSQPSSGVQPPSAMSRCDYKWEVPNSRGPQIPILEGTVCTSDEQVCKDVVTTWAAQSGYSISTNDIEITISSVQSCTELAPEVVNIPNEDFTVSPTLYGMGNPSIGATVRIDSSDAVTVLRQSNLLRDPLQIPPTILELQQASAFDVSRQQTRGLYVANPQTGTRILQRAGVSNSAPLYVEDDLRLNIFLNQIGGGHAGHDYFSIDGKFIDILSEAANWLYYRDNGQLASWALNVDAAMEAIMICHVPTVGFVPPCNFPETEQAQSYFESLYASVIYHEFAHYFLMHIVDIQRAQMFFDAATIFSSVQEDDADYLAGMLQAKAGYDVFLGQDMYTLLTMYSIFRSGGYTTFTSIDQNFQIQFTSNSPRYSGLAFRKQNFRSGYDRFNRP